MSAKEVKKVGGKSLWICLLLIVAFLVTLYTPALAAPEPVITLDPAEGLEGTVVTISGSGFAANSTIIVTWNGEFIATDPEIVRTDEYGSFHCKITVPETPYRDYSVVATDGVGNSAAATFSVLASAAQKIEAGMRAAVAAIIAVPAIISEIANDFFDLTHLRLTDRGNEFVANMVSVISDGLEYSARWMEVKLELQQEWAP